MKRPSRQAFRGYISWGQEGTLRELETLMDVVTLCCVSVVRFPHCNGSMSLICCSYMSVTLTPHYLFLRSGKSSIERVVFRRTSPHETLFLHPSQGVQVSHSHFKQGWDTCHESSCPSNLQRAHANSDLFLFSNKILYPSPRINPCLTVRDMTGPQHRHKRLASISGVGLRRRPQH